MQQTSASGLQQSVYSVLIIASANVTSTLEGEDGTYSDEIGRTRHFFIN